MSVASAATITTPAMRAGIAPSRARRGDRTHNPSQRTSRVRPAANYDTAFELAGTTRAGSHSGASNDASMDRLLSVVATVMAGACIALQPVVNSELGRKTGAL